MQLKSFLKNNDFYQLLLISIRQEIRDTYLSERGVVGNATPCLFGAGI
jgi:hypothetical protein